MAVVLARLAPIDGGASGELESEDGLELDEDQP